MLKKIVLGAIAAIAVVVIALVLVIAMQPSEYHVERSLAMRAPPEEVFAQVNDFRKWENWSPWLDLDPNAKTTYDGPASGEGAIFRWAGNEQVGEGSMTILESQPHEHVGIKLEFLKPMAGVATTDFKFEPTGNETTVTWSMDGTNNFIGKAMCLFLFDMEQMIGSEYEKGLTRMKEIVESAPAVSETADPSPAEPPPAEAETQG